MPPRGRLIRPHHVMEVLYARALYPSHRAREPERQPKWIAEAIAPLEEGGWTYADACAEVAWRAARKVCAAIPADAWCLPGGCGPELLTMCADWPQHPFADLSLGIFGETDMTPSAPPKHQAIARRWRGKPIKLKRAAANDAIESLGLDCGLSIEGKPVTPLPVRRAGSETARLQKHLAGLLDCELQGLETAKAQEVAGTNLEGRQARKVVKDVKEARGIATNSPKGAG